MKIVVDTREPELYSALSNKSNIVESQTLDIGDCHILNEKDQVVLVIERKSMADVIASIMDGRLSEQKHRALAQYSVDKIMYIIQVKDFNDIFNYQHPYNNEWNAEMTSSAVMNLFIRYNISYLYLDSIESISKYIIRMTTQFERNHNYTSSSSYSQHLTHSYIHSQKQKNITPSIFFQASLQLIPGISSTIASNIYNLFDGSFLSFIDFIRDHPKSTFIELYKKHYGRTLNKTVIQKIYELIISSENSLQHSSSTPNITSPPTKITRKPRSSSLDTRPPPRRLLLISK